MIKRIVLMLVVVFSLFLVSCGEDAKVLDTPNVVLTGDVVSWGAVEGADHYLLYIENDIVTVNGTSYNLTNETLEVGTYNLYVVAVKEDTISSNSNLVVYTVEVVEERLASPVLKLTENIVSWDSVDNAESYIVKINDLEITVTDTNYDLSQQSLEPGKYNVTVVAVKDENISFDSKAVRYYIENIENVNTMVEAVLKKFDETYEVGMVEEDFTEITEYEKYVESLNNATSYASAADGVILSSEDAVNLFNDLYDFFEREEQFTDLTDVFALIDIFIANNINAENLTDLVLRYINSEDFNMPENFELIFADYSLVFTDSLELIFGSVFELHANLPADLITLLNNLINQEEIAYSVAAIITIKNDTIVALKDALLEPEEFETLYQLLTIMWAGFNDVEVNILSGELEYLSKLTHHSLKVGLLFIEDITEEDYEAGKLLVNKLKAEMYIEFEQNVNPPTTATMIEVLTFITDYIEAFTLNNQEAVLELEALLDKDLFKPIYEEMIKQIIDSAFPPDYFEEEVNLNSYLKTSLINEYDSIVGIMELIELLGKDIFMTMIDTNGSIIETFRNVDFENATPIETFSEIQLILAELEVYNTNITDALTAEAFENIFSLLVIPMMVESEFYLDENALEIEADLRAIIPNMSEVLVNFISIKKDIFNALETIDIFEYIDIELGYEEPYTLGLSLSIVHLLNEILTVDNKLRIDSSIDLIFDNILTNETIMWLTELEANDLLDAKTLVTDMKDNIYIEVAELASYDYTALDFEEEKAVIAFMNSLGFNFNIDISLETDAEAMARAIPLELGVEKEVMYRTSYLIFSFTPLENGYYEIIVPDVLNEYYVTVKNPMYENMDDYFGMYYDPEGSNEYFLEMNETYYIVLDYDFNISYENVKIKIDEYTFESVIQDTITVFDGYVENDAYSFTATEAGIHEIRFTSDEYFQGFLELKDENNERIHKTYLSTNVEVEYIYEIYLEPDELIYIHLRRSYNIETDLSFEIVIANYEQVLLGVETVVNASLQPKAFYFMATETGFYDLELESVTFSKFELELARPNLYQYEAHMYELEGGEGKTTGFYLEASAILIIRKVDKIGTYIVDMTITKVDQSSLNTIEMNQTLNGTIVLRDSLDYKFVITETAVYEFYLKTTNGSPVRHHIYNNKGITFDDFLFKQPEIDVQLFSYTLSPGVYYLDLHIIPNESAEVFDVVTRFEKQPLETVLLNTSKDVILDYQGEYQGIETVLFTPTEDAIYYVSMVPQDGEALWRAVIRNIELKHTSYVMSITNTGAIYQEVSLKANQTYYIQLTAFDTDNVINITIEKVE